MFTVALVGADGAGKTTIGRRLECSAPIPIKYLYMGVSPISSNYALPTTRLIAHAKRALGRDPDMSGPPDPRRVKARPAAWHRRLLGNLKSLLLLANRLAEESYRQLIAWFYLRRGYVVLFDRHFFTDYYAYDIDNDDPDRPLASRIHGFFLQRIYPRPDVIIFLDAPASLLLARKGEGTLELLNSRRNEYVRLENAVEYFMVVDASRPLDAVVEEVIDLIHHYYESK